MMNDSAKTTKDRYPGLNSFRPDERGIFFGRTRETTELLRLVRAEQMVTLFSKSGLGKSSLLSAGLFPKLIIAGLLPIRIRLQQPKPESSAPMASPAPAKTPVGLVIDAVNDVLGEAYLTNNSRAVASPYAIAKDAPLWEQIKQCPFPEGVTPVLVFDQFEEFFDYPAAEQEAFKRQLAELMHDQAPARVINWLLDLEPQQRTETAIAWSRQPVVKSVFAIRSDRLSEMHSLKIYIPLILRNRYELGPLEKTQAKEAIQEPARMAQAEGPFTTPDYAYQETLLATMLDDLSDSNGAIEGAQLQVVCQFIEQQQKDNLAKNRFKPEVDTLSQEASETIKSIIDTFYRTQLTKLGSEERIEAAARILEDELIEGGRRVGLPEGRMIRLLTEKLGADQTLDVIEQLQENRLIRSESTQLGKTYELSHDTLIRPIEESRKRHALEKDKAQAEALRIETAAKEKAIGLQKRYLWLSIAAGVLLVAMVLVALWAGGKSRENRRLYSKLLDHTALAQYNLGKHYVASAIWNDADSVGNYLFAPYAGKDIQADKTQKYVATLYGDEALEVRKQRERQPDSVCYQTSAAGFTLTGSRLAVYHRDTTNYNVNIIDLTTGQPMLTGLPTASLTATTLSPDGRYAVLIDAKKKSHLYRLSGNAGREILAFADALGGVNMRLASRWSRITFNASATWVLLMDDNSHVWLYDLRRNTLLPRLTTGTQAYRFSADGNRLAVINSGWQLRLFGLAGGLNPTDTVALDSPRQPITKLSFMKDGRIQVGTSVSPQVNIIDLTTNAQTLSDAILLGQSHALGRNGSRYTLRDLRQPTPTERALPIKPGSLDRKFYSPDGLTDTHLLVLYVNRLEMIDLATNKVDTLPGQGHRFARLNLIGDLVEIQLGDQTALDDRNREIQSNADYFAFFIDMARNQPAYLKQFVYPVLTKEQKEQFSLAN